MRELHEPPADDSAGLPTAFSITVEPQRDRVRVAPCGELDIATVGELNRELADLVSAGFSRITIDLRYVEFIDSTGLQSLIAAQSHARSDHWELAIIQGPPAVRRLFELTSTLEYLPFAPETL